jgi:5'-nucleotidase/UDP-sugar diphosphatase
LFKKVLRTLTVISIVCWGANIGAEEGRLTILHTNQLHGRFQLMMKVGALKNQVQSETGAVVLLDAGNAFSPQEAVFEHPDGKMSPTVDIMTRAGYDAWVLGKYETQTDANFLNQALRGAQFSVLGANLHRLQNGRFLFQVQPYAVIQAGGLRVGVLGLGTGAASIGSGDAVLAARYYVPFLKQQADVIVLLTHLGFEADSTLAMEVPDVDLIVGTYSELSSESNSQINGVTIRNAGPWGQSVGRVDLQINQGVVTVQSTQLIPLDIPVGSIDAMTVALSEWTLPLLGERMSVTAALGNSAGGFGASIGQAGAFGYLVADLMRSVADADIALVSALSLDSELPEGAIRVQDLYRVYPPDHHLVVVEMRGEEVSRLMEEGLDDLTAFFYPSGLQVVYDLTKLKGQRLVSLADGDRRPLNLRKTFKVAVESGVAQFMTKEKVSANEKVRNLVAKHIQEAGVIHGRLDDRLQER